MKKIPVCEPVIGKKELEYVTDCIKSGWISSKGKYIDKFERAFADFCGVKYGISTSSGTTAIHLTLASIGVGRKDEVIVPDFTMIASAVPVKHLRAKPVFVDADMNTWCIDPTKIEKKITSKTKAIMPVHIYGHPCDMDAINDIANKHGLYVIEDAAESIGSVYKNKKTGSLGDAACFSFYANKNITTGEGGMVVTDSMEIAERCRLLKDLAFSKPRFLHRELGYNFRMTNVQAAIGYGQMRGINKSVNARISNAKLYNKLLGKVRGITTPPEADWAKNSYWMYTIMLENRNGIIQKLREYCIETRRAFFPMHQQPCFRQMLYKQNHPNFTPSSIGRDNDFPNAVFLSNHGINLPSGGSLTESDIHYVADTIKELIR